jgi:long-subunit acyl-CoA synthetase (AMP-forming)
MSQATTAFELFADNLAQGAARIALIDGAREVTYGELAHEVAAIAQWLREHGIERGQRVVVHLRKSVSEVAAELAVWAVGAICVNVSAQWTVRQLEYVMDDAEAAASIVDARRAAELTHRVTPMLVPGHDTRVRAELVPTRLVDRDLAAIVYTSGSTGAPKGVVLSHQNLVLGARAVVRYLGIRESDRLLGL